MKLEDLTMAEYIDMMCEDLSRYNEVRRVHIEKEKRDLMLEYQGICDPGGVKKYLADGKRALHARISMLLYTLCDEMTANGDISGAKGILEKMRVPVAKMGDDRIQAEIQSRLARARKDMADIEKQTEAEKQETGNLRLSFDRQTAIMMSHFKFQISHETIKATQYACLVAQMNAELKAQKDALQKIRK